MRVTLALILAALFVAGCMGHGPQRPGNTTDGPGNSSPSLPTSSVPVPPVGNVSLPAITFEGCHGTVIGFAVPESRAEPYVPAAFTANGLAPMTTTLLLDVFRCDRAVAGSMVAQDVAFLWSSIHVSPKNQSWAVGGFSAINIDPIVSNATVALALRNAGAKANVASFQAAAGTQTPTITEEDWTFEAAGFSYRVRFHHLTDKPASTTPESRKMFYWSHDGIYNRTDITQRHTGYHDQGVDDAAIVDVTGDTKFATMIGGQQTTGDSANWFDVTLEIPATPIRFTET
jgi:hypothetical protein